MAPRFYGIFLALLMLAPGMVGASSLREEEGTLSFYAYLAQQISSAEEAQKIPSRMPEKMNWAVTENLASSLPDDDPLLLYWLHLNYLWANDEERRAWRDLFASHPAFKKLYALYPKFLDPRANKTWQSTMPTHPHNFALWRDHVFRMAALAAISAAVQQKYFARKPSFIALDGFRKYFGHQSAPLLHHWWFKGFREIYRVLIEFMRFAPDNTVQVARMQHPLGQKPSFAPSAVKSLELYAPIFEEKTFTLQIGELLRDLWSREGLAWDQEIPSYLPDYHYYGGFSVDFDEQQKLRPSYLKPVPDPLLQAILDFVGQMAMGLAENGLAGSLPQIKLLLASWLGVQTTEKSYIRAPLLKLQTDYRQRLIIALNLPLAAYYQEQGKLDAKLSAAKNAALHRILKSCQYWLLGPRWN